MKTNLKISRGSTINVGNFESIKPSISIELLDVPVEKVKDTYFLIDTLLDELIKLETASAGIEIREIKNTGIDNHIQSILNTVDGIKKNISVTMEHFEKTFDNGKK